MSHLVLLLYYIILSLLNVSVCALPRHFSWDRINYILSLSLFFTYCCSLGLKFNSIPLMIDNNIYSSFFRLSQNHRHIIHNLYPKYTRVSTGFAVAKNPRPILTHRIFTSHDFRQDRTPNEKLRGRRRFRITSTSKTPIKRDEYSEGEVKRKNFARKEKNQIFDASKMNVFVAHIYNILLIISSWQNCYTLKVYP